MSYIITFIAGEIAGVFLICILKIGGESDKKWNFILKRWSVLRSLHNRRSKRNFNIRAKKLLTKGVIWAII